MIADERAGKFGGQTVQMVPHLTNSIKAAIREAAEGDVHIVEIGGTVGDYEGLSFIEAIRGFALDVGSGNLPVRARGVRAVFGGVARV